MPVNAETQHRPSTTPPDRKGPSGTQHEVSTARLGSLRENGPKPLNCMFATGSRVLADRGCLSERCKALPNADEAPPTYTFRVGWEVPHGAAVAVAAGVYGSWRVFWRFGRFSTGTKPRRIFIRCSSFVFSRTARRLRIRCWVSGVQNTSRRSRARVIAV